MKRNKLKEFYEKHKTAILAGGALTVAVVALGIAIKNGDSGDIPKVLVPLDPGIEPLSGLPDLGRDCFMKCFVEETGEELPGKVLCTETYWNEEVDIFSQCK